MVFLALHNCNMSIMCRLPQSVYLSLRFYNCSRSILNWETGLDVTAEKKHEIEEKWRRSINQYHFNEHDDSRPKAYILSMFPYPSGALHMGHVRVYTISDTLARFYRMKGYNVLHPMGWDAFGLPAENAAIEHGEEPAMWTKKNIQKMKEQLNQLGCSFDWDHEIETCHPTYYRWTQYIFLQMLKAGLVYRKPELVNWDPVDKTVLAEEQIDENGHSWRSGAKVEKVLLTQWFIKATKFAKSLSDGLNTLLRKDWADIIKVQNAWIGNVNGFVFDWAVSCCAKDIVIPIWTESPERLDKVTFIAVSPSSILDVVEKGPELTEHSYSDGAGKSKTFKVRRLEALATNPISGEQVPIFVVEGLLPFVEGTNAYLGIPSIASVDKIFATLFGLPVTPLKMTADNLEAVSRERACAEAQSKGSGGYASSPHLKDWLISRQRYWGTPIPVIHCPACGAVPVPEEQLPVTLPSYPKHRSSGSLGSPLLDATSWLHTTCPKCGGPSTRETDTMDTFVDSAWYYLRYIDPKNGLAPFNTKKVNKFMPVDIYIGGKEHAVLHLYFARLISHFLHDINLVAYPEPFKRLLVQGMVMGQSYRESLTGRYLKQDEVDLSGEVPCSIQSGKPVTVGWEKMSKSKHNGIDPSQVISLHGVDTLRLQMLADVAPTSNRNWSLDGTKTTLDLQNSLFHLVSKFISLRRNAAKKNLKRALPTGSFNDSEKQIMLIRNQHLSFINFNYEVSYQLMVVITRIIAFIRDLMKVPEEVMMFGPEFERAIATLLLSLAPISPHFVSELWEGCASAPGRTEETLSLINWDKPVLEQSWPLLDKDFGIPVIVEINKCEICTTYIPHEKLELMEKNDALQCVLENETVRRCLGKVVPSVTFFQKFSGYRAKIHLKAPELKINPEDLDPRTKAGKKALSKMKRQEKKIRELHLKQ